MKSEVTPLVGMLLWWSVSWAGKLFITSSVREKHPAIQTPQSTLWERDSEWLNHFIPSSLFRSESQHGCRKSYRMWQIHLQCHLLKVTLLIHFFMCKFNPAKRSCGRTRNTRAFPLKGWHDTKATSSRPATFPQRRCHSSKYFLSEGFSLLCAIYSIF